MSANSFSSDPIQPVSSYSTPLFASTLSLFPDLPWSRSSSFLSPLNPAINENSSAHSVSSSSGLKSHLKSTAIKFRCQFHQFLRVESRSQLSANNLRVRKLLAQRDLNRKNFDWKGTNHKLKNKKKSTHESAAAATTDKSSSHSPHRIPLFQWIFSPSMNFSNSPDDPAISPSYSCVPMQFRDYPPFPLSVACVPIDKNIPKDDDRKLHFVPYFGEKDDSNIDISMYATDNEETREVDELDEDYVLLTLIAQFGDSEIVFKSLSELFELPADSIKKRYLELIEVADQRRRHQHRDLLSHGTDNFDLSNSLDSYEKLFCRRCFIFDCKRHGNCQPRPRGSDERKIFSDQKIQQIRTNLDQKRKSEISQPNNSKAPTESASISDSSTFCSANCFKHFLDSNGDSNRTRPTVSSWSEIDFSMFRKLYFVFGRSNSCSIAAVVGKNCYEVQEKIRVEGSKLIERTQLESLMNESGNKGADEHEFDDNSTLNTQKRSGGRKRKKNFLKSSKSKVSRAPRGLPLNYFPCDHLGPCNEKSNCLCFTQNRKCEKFCGCDQSSCERIFNGCQCRNGKCQTKYCICFAENRECDPDKCGNCQLADRVEKNHNAATTADEFNSADERYCLNNSLQFGSRKRLFLGRSAVHGWGAFCFDGAKKGELITEYVGELISQDEADRRGKIYDKMNRSYLFNLNEEFVVDAARKGNEIRYANHSENPNCYSRVVTVAGDHRIGIYAKRKIRPGEELLFHYQHEHAGAEPDWFMEAKGNNFNKGGFQHCENEELSDEPVETRMEEKNPPRRKIRIESSNK